MANTIKVNVLADIKDMTNKLGQIDGKLGNFGGTLKKVAKLVASAFVAKAVVDFGKEIVNLASEAEQSIGGVDAVFGENAKQIHKWSKTSAKRLGLSRTDYRNFSTYAGAMLKNLGVPMDEQAEKTDWLISLGSDLAATYGGPTSDAVSALSALLRGERDPIERYGVSIKQADINARLAQKGLEGLEGEAKKNAEAMATLELLTEQTADAQGMFASESDTLANKQQILRAQWEDMKTDLGTALLPAVSSVFGYIVDTAIPAVQKLADWLGDKLGPAVDKVVGFFGDLGDTSSNTGHLVAEVVDLIKSKGESLADLWNNVIKPAFTGAGDSAGSLKETLDDLLVAIMDFNGDGTVSWEEFVEAFTLGLNLMIESAMMVFGHLFNIVGTFVTVMSETAQGLKALMEGDISGAFNHFKNAGEGAFEGVKRSAEINMNFINGITIEPLARMSERETRRINRAYDQSFGSMTKTTGTFVSDYDKQMGNIPIDTAKHLKKTNSDASRELNNVRDTTDAKAKDAAGKWKSGMATLNQNNTTAWSTLNTEVGTGTDRAVAKTGTLPGRMQSSMPTGSLRSTGSSIMSGFIGGIESKFSSVRSTLSRLTSMLPSWKGPAKRDAKLLYNAGQLIMGGLIDGIDSKENALKKELRGVSGIIAGTEFGTPALVGGGSSGIYGTTHITVNVNAPSGDGAEIGRVISGYLNEWKRVNG